MLLDMSDRRSVNMLFYLRQLTASDGYWALWAGLPAGLLLAAGHYFSYASLQLLSTPLTLRLEPHLPLLSSVLPVSLSVLSAMLCYPLDTVRRLQIIQRRLNIQQAALQIWRQEGLRGFYEGAAVHSVRIVMMTLVNRLLSQLQNKLLGLKVDAVVPAHI
jgi:hypothetical protein